MKSKSKLTSLCALGLLLGLCSTSFASNCYYHHHRHHHHHHHGPAVVLHL